MGERARAALDQLARGEPRGRGRAHPAARPRLAPRGPEEWYDAGLTRYKVCDGAEDPTCSLRKPGFKINGDHFGYFPQALSTSAACGAALEQYREEFDSYLPYLV